MRPPKSGRVLAWASRIVGEGAEAPEDLLANPRNWRIHPAAQQEALSGVLNTVGVVQRVIVNRASGFVVDGHLRVALALSEGVEEVPVSYVELTDEEEALVLATFDPTGAMAGTDRTKLEELLSEAKEGEAARKSERVMDFLREMRVSGGGGPGRGENRPKTPEGWREYGEDAAKDVKKATCPECGHIFPV